MLLSLRLCLSYDATDVDELRRYDYYYPSHHLMISELSLVLYMLRSCMPGVMENGAIPSAHLPGGETDESIKDPARCIVLARAFIISHIMHASSFWQEFVLHPYYTIPPVFPSLFLPGLV